MQCKDLAYSVEQITEFLLQMQGVSVQGPLQYSYGAVRICLQAQDMSSCQEEQKKAWTSMQALPRSYMYLYGEKQHIEAFYKKFMLYHMTMGG